MKTKILLISLGIISLLAVGLAAWIYLSAQTEVARYAKEQTELEKQGDYLQEKLDALEKESRHWQSKSEEITSALNRLGKEYTLLQTQYDSLLKKKDSLAKESESLKTQVERLGKVYSKQKERVKISATDQFLSSLLEEKATQEVKIDDLKARISAQEAHLEDLQRQMLPSLE
ncbi:MAG: hypothetical protein NG712_00460, partial [Omnitrophica bacterium]|nr:hypothetical protein [Candidatus Omnitrophota bacterium]